MIPQQNTRHVVLSFPTERIEDLILAIESAGILPKVYPKDGGWDTLDIPFARLDLGLRLRFRMQFGRIAIDAIQLDRLQEFRFGADIALIDTFLDAYELSTGLTLASLEFAVSGRVYVAGSLEVRPSAQAVFFVLRQVRATPDDTSAGLPTPWPAVDLQQIMGRVADRALRVQLNAAGRLPERALPIDPVLNTGGLIGFPLVMNFATREPVSQVDWLSYNVCLPAGMGDAHCSAGPGAVATFFERLDIYASPPSTAPPIPVNLIGRQFQIDMGIVLLRRALADQRKPSWSGSPKFLMYRFVYDLEADIRAWPGTTTGDVGFWFQLSGTQQIWYPKVKMCRGWTDTPFGRIEFDYPCGVEDGWLDVTTITVTTMFRLYSSPDGSSICIERNGPNYSSQPNLWGELYDFIMQTLIDLIPIIGPIVSIGMEVVDVLVMIVSIITALVAKLIDDILPGELCFPIGRTFARLPLLDDRIEIALSNTFCEMKANGITIGFDGEFEKR
jgi:hypothetical protein